MQRLPDLEQLSLISTSITPPSSSLDRTLHVLSRALEHNPRDVALWHVYLHVYSRRISGPKFAEMAETGLRYNPKDPLIILRSVVSVCSFFVSYYHACPRTGECMPNQITKLVVPNSTSCFPSLFVVFCLFELVCPPPLPPSIPSSPHPQLTIRFTHGSIDTRAFRF